MFKLFSFKKGAMFGIDARVTFAVTAIAAFIVGINQFTDIEKSNKESADLDLREVKNSVLNYYDDNYTVVADIATLINNNYFVWQQKYNEDPWGGAYQINTITESKTIENAVMDVKYITLISYGKNGVRDITLPANYSEWLNLETTGDDIIYKFDTLEIERKVAQIETAQLNIVRNLLNNYLAVKKEELSTFCAIKSNQRDFYCDVNEDSKYEKNEELTINFMPKDIDDTNGKYYLVKHIVHGTDAKFKSGYINTTTNSDYNMYSFISQIGGSSFLVKSPRGLVLHFTSNKYNNITFPYYAEVWYDDEVTIF